MTAQPWTPPGPEWTEEHAALMALRRELFDADHCHGIVTRDGEMDACGKPPTSIIDARGAEDGCYWPACAYHAHRYGYGHVVPLADLIAAVRAEGL